jgi:type II secretory pathway pseudopilin PulG
VVELLTVFAILAILVGLLTPVFRNARDSANRNVTVSNLRQIYTALTLYRPDFDSGVYGSYTAMGLPPSMGALGVNEKLPVTVFRSGCPSVRAPFLGALFRQMWHEDGDPSQQDWAPYTELYQGNSVLVGDDNCDFRDRFFKNPLVSHRGISLYVDGHVSTIVRIGSTAPYEWWSLTQEN